MQLNSGPSNLRELLGVPPAHSTYRTHDGGPLVIRGDKGIPPDVIGRVVRHARRSHLEYLTACDGALTEEASRAREAGDLAADVFRHCDAYAADFSIKDLFK